MFPNLETFVFSYNLSNSNKETRQDDKDDELDILVKKVHVLQPQYRIPYTSTSNKSQGVYLKY